MKVTSNHAHADIVYEPITYSNFYRHFIALLIGVIETKRKGYLSLTTHIPYNLMHPTKYPVGHFKLSLQFIRLGELLKRIFKIKLYWENAPALEYGTWELKFKDSPGFISFVPPTIDLCFDTGHFILSMANLSITRKDLIRRYMLDMFKVYGHQIKHIHLNENDLISDQHLMPFEIRRPILTKTFINKITEGRSYIYER